MAFSFFYKNKALFLLAVVSAQNEKLDAFSCSVLRLQAVTRQHVAPHGWSACGEVGLGLKWE